MKLTCTQENFRKAIFNSERIVSRQGTLPILNNIFFEAEKGELKLAATNLEMGVEVRIGAKVESGGKITIPAKLVSNFVNNLYGKNSEENLSLETSGQDLKIKSGSARAIIKGLPADDFPLIPKKETETLLKIPSKKIKEAITQTISCVAANETRQELTGINIIFEEKTLFFAATDSFRLAEKKIDLAKEDIDKDAYQNLIKRKNSIIVPSNTMTELTRILSKEEGKKIGLAIEENQIFFEIGGATLISRLINGKYPEYKHIIPKEFKTRVIMEKEALQSAVKIASLFSSGKTNEIVFNIDADKENVRIGAKSAELGENSTESKNDVVGPSQGIVFNPRYLLDGINTIATEQVAVLINGNASPAVLKEIDQKTGEVMDGFIYVVMPIKN